jgi:hypothetical protein
MTLIEQAQQALVEREESCLFADGLERAFVGLGYQFTKPLAVYSRRRVLRVFQRQGMSYEEAVEYFDFNVAGAWVGEQTPVFLDD